MQVVDLGQAVSSRTLADHLLLDLACVLCTPKSSSVHPWKSSGPNRTSFAFDYAVWFSSLEVPNVYLVIVAASGRRPFPIGADAHAGNDIVMSFVGDN